MVKLTAVTATDDEQAFMAAGVGAARAVLKRFGRANAVAGNPVLQAEMRVNEYTQTWTAYIPGIERPEGHGTTLELAIGQLVQCPDAGFIRKRAARMRAEAEQLDREADEMDGGAGAGAAPGRCDRAGAAAGGYDPQAEVSL